MQSLNQFDLLNDLISREMIYACLFKYLIDDLGLGILWQLSQGSAKSKGHI